MTVALEPARAAGYLQRVNDRIIGAYRLTAPLGAGAMGAVFSAVHTTTSQRVALKIALARDPIASECVRREIRLLAQIRHPGVVGLLGHGVDGVLPWYAMELIEGQGLDAWIDGAWRHRAVPSEVSAAGAQTRPMRGSTLSVASVTGDDADDVAPAEHLRRPCAGGRLPDVVQIFARLCQTLSYLHGEGIVHLDLKPSNILLRPDGQPVVLDFGITRQIAGGLNREVLNVDALQGGTEFYMAPEQIAGNATDARTDLYALGCMLFEALAGRPPFVPTALSVRDHHLHTAARPPSTWVSGIPPELDAAVMQLLQKRVERRIGFASDTLELLLSLGAQLDSELAVRQPKPYLYRPRLVGRDDVMRALTDELERAVNHQGRCVFLLAPSGAGKTRLAIELGREAFARDMRVLSGECSPAAIGDSLAGPSGRPLQPFAALLTTVVELCVAGGAEATAALVGDALPVLENIERRFAQVPGRAEFAEPLPMGVAGAHGRIEHAVSDTIVATAAARPLLLVVDDLQWADSLSQGVVRAFAEHRNTDACMLVTCRADQLTPEIDALTRHPNAVRYHLDALPTVDVATLIAGMLAYEQAPPALVKLIGERSGGNPFFVAEYLAAVVAAGGLKRANGRWVLDASAELQLPNTPEALLSARMRNLTVPARELLEFAAVLGREFPRELLRPSLGATRPAFEHVEELQYRGILIEDGPSTLRFTHDKLREACYSEISFQRRQQLHSVAAAHLKALPLEVGNVARLDRSVSLAHHFFSAGAQADYFDEATRAAAFATSLGAHRQAARLYRDALTLSEKSALLQQKNQQFTIAQHWAAYGALLENLGDVEAAVPTLQRALALLGYRIPVGTPALMWFVARQLVTQIAHRVVAPGAVRADSARLRLAEAAQCAAVLARGYVGTNRQLGVFGAVLLAANLSERARAERAIVHSHAFLGAIVGLTGLNNTAERYFERARRSAAVDGSLEAAAMLAQIEGFYFLTRARWQQTIETLSPVLERCWADGAVHFAEGPLLTLSYVHMLLGDLRRAGEYTRLLLDVASDSGNERFGLIGELALALHDLYRGQHQRALDRLEKMDSRVMLFGEFIHIANVLATRSSLLSWLGRHEEAVAFADRAREALKDTGTRNALLYNVHAFTPQAYLRAWADAAEHGRPVEVLQKRAWAAVNAAREFSAVCPYAEPCALRFEGSAQALAGNTTKAKRTLLKCVEVSAQQGNVYEMAQTAQQLATLCAGAERDHQLGEAAKHFGVLRGAASTEADAPVAALTCAPTYAVDNIVPPPGGSDVPTTHSPPAST